MPASSRLLIPARMILTLAVGLATVTAVGSHPAEAATAASSTSTTKTTTQTPVAKKALTKAQKRKLAKKRHARAVARKAANGLAIARKQIGDPYSYGASGPNAFDCSGLVMYSFHRAGFRGVPRTSGAQAAHTKRLSRKAMRPGDLMFFHNGGRVYHAAVFAGRKNGKMWMVHAPGSGRRVQVATPWTNSWFPGTLRR